MSEPDDVLAVVADALRLPYVALRSSDGELAAYGVAPEVTEAIPLRYRGEQVGELVVGVRAGQRALDRADRAALELLAVPLGGGRSRDGPVGGGAAVARTDRRRAGGGAQAVAPRPA